MKVTKVTAEFLNVPLESEFRPTWNPGVIQTSISMTLVRVRTDEGLVGIGAGPCSGPAAAVLLGSQAQQLLEGLDPFRIEEIARRMRPVVNEYAWPWCIEMAVWDILGKATGQPVAKLLGGYTDTLPTYASLGEYRPTAERIDDIHRLQDEGFRAVKLRFRADAIRDDLALVAALRGEFGPTLTLMVDANQGHVMPGSARTRVWDLKTALYVADALAELDVAWLEEPLPRRQYRELSELTRMARLPIAGGELNLRLDEFTILIGQRCYDLIQADAAFSEGIWGCRKIAAMAEAFGLPFMPHTWSNGIGLLANFQLAASLGNCPYLEIPYDPPAFTHAGRDRLLRQPLTVDRDGFAHLPEGPGLGVEFDEAFIAHLKSG